MEILNISKNKNGLYEIIANDNGKIIHSVGQMEEPKIEKAEIKNQFFEIDGAICEFSFVMMDRELVYGENEL